MLLLLLLVCVSSICCPRDVWVLEPTCAIEDADACVAALVTFAPAAQRRARRLISAWCAACSALSLTRTPYTSVLVGRRAHAGAIVPITGSGRLRLLSRISTFALLFALA